MLVCQSGHKSNIGHTGCASGLSSVITTIVALQHRCVPIHLNVTEAIPLVADTPSVTLPCKHPVRLSNDDATTFVYGSISGTSANGDNTHLILECRADSKIEVLEAEDITDSIASLSAKVTALDSGISKPAPDSLRHNATADDAVYAVAAVILSSHDGSRESVYRR